MNTDSIINNMIRAAKLDVDFFNAVEHDESKNTEALLVVIIAAVAMAINNGINGVLALLLGSFAGVKVMGPLSVIVNVAVGLISVVVGYYLWSYLTYFIGTRLFGGEAEPGEVLRTFGYAYSPQVLAILGFIPCLGWIIALAGSIWSLVAGVIAIREAMDFDTTKALLTAGIAWLIVFILNLVVGATIGLSFASFGALTG